VARYCDETFGPSVINDELILLLAAHSFSAVGEDEISSVLRAGVSCLESSALCEAGAMNGAELVCAWRLEASGVVRRIDWSSRRGMPNWLIDLDALRWEEGDQVELVLFPILRRLLGALTPVWDASLGHGCLALGLSVSRAGCLLSAGRSRRASRGSLAVVKGYAAAVLAKARAQRGWINAPEVCFAKL
jgi:hypothetical protein